MQRPVRCFCVLVHGQFEHRVHTASAEMKPRGFYTTRWVVATGRENAVQKAFRSTKLELQQWPYIRDGLAEVGMEAEEVGPGSWWRWLKGGGRGFSFYIDDD